MQILFARVAFAAGIKSLMSEQKSKRERKKSIKSGWRK